MLNKKSRVKDKKVYIFNMKMYVRMYGIKQGFIFDCSK